MNGYIINPAWFYWIDVVNAVKGFAIVSAIVLLLGTGLVSLLFMDDVFGDERERYNKILPKTAIAGVIFLLAAIFIPSKETLIEMQIAKYATWENAEWTVDTIKDVVDYIVNAIGSIK